MPTAEDSGRYRNSECFLCEGSGTLSWQQPQPSGVLRTIEMPCPTGCGDHWKHPYAERGRVVEQADTRPVPPQGNVAAANRIGADFIRAALENWGFHAGNRDYPDR